MMMAERGRVQKEKRNNGQNGEPEAKVTTVENGHHGNRGMSEVEDVGRINGIRGQIDDDEQREIVPRHILLEQKMADLMNNITEWSFLQLRAIRDFCCTMLTFMMVPLLAAYHKAVFIWNEHNDLIKKILRWTFYGIIALSIVLLCRLFVMLYTFQDEVSDFESFVKEKDQKISKILDAQNFHVGDLYEVQEELKEQLEAVEKKSSDDLASHSGALVEIQTSIVEVKDQFQDFMVKSQMHMLELQEENQKLQKDMINMQHGMNQEMGSIRGDVKAVRSEYSRMKHSLDSIDYNINKIKNCGFWGRLFGVC